MNSASRRIPVQRNGFRYVPARPVPDVPLCYEEDYFKDQVGLSWNDRSREVIVDDTRSMVTGGRRGYRSALATHGADKPGSYYFEVDIKEAPSEKEGHVRIGLALLGSHLGGPVGMSRTSYAVCDRGFFVHDSFRHGNFPSFGPGDTIGVLLSINEAIPKCEEVKPGLARYHRIIYFEDRIAKPVNEKMDASIEFFLNGVSLGTPFNGLTMGVYFPMISVYGGATAEFRSDNFKFNQSSAPWSSLFSSRRVEYSFTSSPTELDQSKDDNTAHGSPNDSINDSIKQDL